MTKYQPTKKVAHAESSWKRFEKIAKSNKNQQKNERRNEQRDTSRPNVPRNESGWQRYEEIMSRRRYVRNPEGSRRDINGFEAETYRRHYRGEEETRRLGAERWHHRGAEDQREVEWERRRPRNWIEPNEYSYRR